MSAPDKFERLEEWAIAEGFSTEDMVEFCRLQLVARNYQVAPPNEHPLKGALSTDEVDHAYEGERGQCCCGCCGVHYTRVEEGGYREFDPAEVDRIVTDINDAATCGERVEDHGDHVTVDVGSSTLIAYRREKDDAGDGEEAET